MIKTDLMNLFEKVTEQVIKDESATFSHLLGRDVPREVEQDL